MQPEELVPSTPGKVYSPEEKQAILKEAESNGVLRVAEKAGIDPSTT